MEYETEQTKIHYGKEKKYWSFFMPAAPQNLYLELNISLLIFKVCENEHGSPAQCFRLGATVCLEMERYSAVCQCVMVC